MTTEVFSGVADGVEGTNAKLASQFDTAGAVAGGAVDSFVKNDYGAGISGAANAAA